MIQIFLCQDKKNPSSDAKSIQDKGKVTTGNSVKNLESKLDNISENSQNSGDKDNDAMEEDKFEKTANELEEVLKRKFPDVSPPKSSSPKSQSVSKPTMNTTVPNLSTLPAIKQEFKDEPGIFYHLIQ